jgi:biotin carboxyl carrier protein
MFVGKYDKRDVLCVIETMKLFNEIDRDLRKIVKY